MCFTKQRNKQKMKKKRLRYKLGFTLVEMVIVITIIWVLAISIIPKLNNTIARTRDLKRTQDLNTIAAALTTYKETHWYYPLRDYTPEEQEMIDGNPLAMDGQNRVTSFAGYLHLLGGANGLKNALSSYLTDIPSDPNKNHRISHLGGIDRKRPSLSPKDYPTASPPGEYYYQLVYSKAFGAMTEKELMKYFWAHPVTRGGKSYMVGLHKHFVWNAYPHIYETYPRSAILVAKVETPDYANYVAIPKAKKPVYPTKGWAWIGEWPYMAWYYGIPINDAGYTSIDMASRGNIDGLYLCSSISRVKKGEEKMATATDASCKFSDYSQLYHIIKLE